MALVGTSLPGVTVVYVFSRAYCRLGVFLRLPAVTRFPALAIGHMFSRAYRRLHIFPRLSPVTRFLALATGYMFSLRILIGCFYFFFSLVIGSIITLVLLSQLSWKSGKIFFLPLGGN